MFRSAAAALFVLTGFAQPTPPQPATGGSWRFLTGYHSEQPSAFEAISLLLRVAEVPSGFVALRSCAADVPVVFNIPAGMELHSALDEVFAFIGGGYRQEERNSVINVLPALGVPALLKVRIEKLTIDDPSNLTLSVGQIEETPAFRRALLATGAAQWERLSIISSVRQPGDPEPPKPQPLEIRDMLVIDVLNLLVLRHGSAVWLYSEYRCAGRRPHFGLTFIRR
ncbi:hypothetical protein [uncultured Paludibaculum sp.]|uniref:hypothetical protein n=1 Tax=uncultured Paludibaculum sp. TaxID=1765020 RepID=UPI002AAAF5D4|nr:hypothetical protein [uncultured Paludibaculum sp.]